MSHLLNAELMEGQGMGIWFLLTSKAMLSATFNRPISYPKMSNDFLDTYSISVETLHLPQICFPDTNVHLVINKCFSICNKRKTEYSGPISIHIAVVFGKEGKIDDLLG